MAKEMTNYQCPACGGALHYDSELGKLKCDNCDSTYTVEEMDKLYKEKIENAGSNFDLSNLSDDWGADAKKIRVYDCPSCGAQLIYDDTTAATNCPYCDNPNVVPGQFAGTLKPDYIIPFQLDKKAAVDKLKEHYKRFLIPKAFKEQSHLEEVKGVYVPFWLYDAKVDADCTFAATKTHIHREGDYEVTETDHFRVERAGVVDFQKVPADGSSKMDDDYMDSIEPFDYSKLKDFSISYLPGYMADRYDVTAKDNFERVDHRFRNSAQDLMYQDVRKTSVYDTITATSENANIHRGKVSYALMPVWTLHTKWNGKDYTFMMNGQTGKMVGDLPVDKTKLRVTTGAVFIVASVLFQVLGVGNLLASLIGGFFM